MAGKGRYIHIGTSGWHYDHWIGRFYPEGLSKNDWLSYYMQHFDTVEINNTFYHLPKETYIKRWYKLAPRGFVYTIKANRYITHIKKLRDVSEELQRFFERIDLLKSHLGPILYQLPPSLRKDLSLLKDFIELLGRDRISVFEFRNDSWYCDETYQLLDKNRLGFCTHDMPGKPSPKITTGNIIYVRFHGASGRYSGDYPDRLLRSWADWMLENAKTTTRIFAYFNNDYNAYAPKNALTLKKMMLS